MSLKPLDLDAEVRALLEERRGSWDAIHKETGISHSWISKFVNRKIPNPGYHTLKRLRDHLAKPVSA